MKTELETNIKFLESDKTGTVMFQCDEIILESGSIQLKMPEFLPLETINKIVFRIKGKEYVFIKERG